MKLVVGLGNPGRKYDGTRHNIGYDVIHSLADRHHADPSRLKFEGELRECQIHGERTLLLMPHTFMNLSGRSIRQAVDFYKIDREDLLLVCDDFNLDLGILRLRAEGSHGGQKGLADTINRLGSNEFARLRVGIGPVPDRWDAADFVLGKFAKSEQSTVEDQIIRTCNAIETWITDGVDRAMNQHNGG